MEKPIRSGCPINLTLETLGDRWSLIVIRDIMFGNRRHYRDLLNRSEEGIASNILADRLKKLTEAGLLSAAPDPSTSRRRFTASPNLPSSSCRCWRKWGPGAGGTRPLHANFPSAHNCLKRAARPCGKLS
jgi:hypothetical protein